MTLLTCCLGSPACSDVYEAHYEDLPAARSAGAIEQGWLPTVLPADAVDIREVHDIDTNETWGCFSAPSGPGFWRDSLLAAHQARRSRGPVAPTGLTAPSWWPTSMASNATETYEYLESPGYSLRFGADLASNRVCFYRSSRGSSIAGHRTLKRHAADGG